MIQTIFVSKEGDLEFDTELFILRLESRNAFVGAVRKAGGRHTKFCHKWMKFRI